MNAAPQKHCFKCDSHKSLSSFSADKTRRDGLQPKCKDCMRAYYEAHREKIKAASAARHRRIVAQRTPKKYRTAEEKKAYAALWQKQNRDKARAASAKWDQNNPGRKEELRRAWIAENRERMREAARRLRAANLGRYASYVQQRNAQKLRAIPAWADMNKIKAIYDLAPAVSRRTGVRHQVDHIVPLRSPLVCGLHCEANLQVIPAIENYVKGNRWWPDMPT